MSLTSKYEKHVQKGVRRTIPKIPSPESVGITEFIGKERIGGTLKTHVRDFQVREVGIDGKVARMSGEPLLKGWAVVEKEMTKQKMHILHDFDDEAQAEHADGIRDGYKGDEATSFFHQGYDMGLREAEDFIKRKCGIPAVGKMQRFLAEPRVAIGGGYVAMCCLGKKELTPNELVKLKGALLKRGTTSKVMFAVATKFHSENLEIGIVVNAELNLQLRNVMEDEDARRLLRFFVAGYSSETLTLCFRQRLRRYKSASELLQAFKEATKGTLRDLDFELFGEDKENSFTVIARWTREYTQLSLSGVSRWRLVLEKQNVDLQSFLLKLEQRLRLPRDSVHYAGLKDKRGITHQFVSVPATHNEGEIRSAVQQLNEDMDGTGSVRVDSFQADNTGRKLRSGMLMGTAGSLSVTGLVFESGESVSIGGALLAGDMKRALQLWAWPLDEADSFINEIYQEWVSDDRASKALKRLSTLPGHSQDKFKLWIRLLELTGDGGDESKYRDAVKQLNLPKVMLHLFPTAYSACLWNRLASRRIRDGGLTVNVGDLVAIAAGDDFEKLKRVELEQEATQYDITDIRLPQLGLQREGICPMAAAGVQVDRLYKELVEDSVQRGEAPPSAREGLSHDLTMLLACRIRNVSIARPLVVKPLAVSAKDEARRGPMDLQNLILEFYLPRGSYATSLLREIGVIDAPGLSQA
ncbi:hypothetical protein FOL47_003238 [Perkinsus chesapeaki]|uniref:Multisubstrate pseudouridine synthase 7 n=1 Tax=Perkinsus chesapeaki TaxID=330153 RepID=A0A7J6N371_PERCH|nr:hypothetical protein FOL47_003238 [Perkinsus chesapeaki]